MRILDINFLAGSNSILQYGNELLVTELSSSEESFHLVNGSVKAGFTFLVHVREGDLDISINDRHYEVHKDQMLVCNNGVIVHNIHMSEGCQALLIGYYLPYFFPEHNSYALTQVWDRLMEPFVLNITPFRKEACISMQYLCESILNKITDNELKKEAVIGFLRIVLASIGQWYFNDMDGFQKETSDENKLFTMFIKDIREHCVYERSVAYYASRAHLSPKYFSSLIYKFSGTHPSDWIRKYTVVTAKGMLKSKQFTVQQVSEKMNFPNSSFFGKYFKEATGMTPRQYMLNDEI